MTFCPKEQFSPDDRAALDVAEEPDFGAAADRDVGVDVAAWVYEIIRHGKRSFQIKDKNKSFGPAFSKAGRSRVKPWSLAATSEKP